MKRRIKWNIWGNCIGYLGTKKVHDFGLDDYEALLWKDTGLRSLEATEDQIRIWREGYNGTKDLYSQKFRDALNSIPA